MHTVFLTGLLLLIGLGVGELFKKLKLPKITGYLLAGFLLINSSEALIPDAYLSISQVIITLGLAFISFEIGGHLNKEKSFFIPV